MLACIACSKHVNGSVEPALDEDGGTPRSPATKDTIKSLTNQLKGMAVRFSAGAYRHCRTAGLGGTIGNHIDDTSGHCTIDSMDILDASSELGSSSTHNSVGGSALSSQYSTPAQSFKGTPSRSRRDTPTSTHIAYTRNHHHQDSNNTSKHGGSNHHQANNISKIGAKDVERRRGLEIVAANGPKLDHEDQNEPKLECEEERVENEKEWVAQVEPGVLITFVTLLDGGNDLKRIRFSREMFNKWQAQQWWAENCDKVHELYNVPKFNRMPGSLPTPSRSEDESYKSQSSGEYKKQNSYPQSRKQGEVEGRRDKRKGSGHVRGVSMVGEVMGATDMSSACASEWEAASEEADTHQQPHLSQCRSSADQGSGEEEWVQEDEPGVYITLVSCNGSTELKRIRFSREIFTEMQARSWWEENRIRVYEHYL